jgi:RNA polymerase sigma-70 factor (sigma-E family)
VEYVTQGALVSQTAEYVRARYPLLLRRAYLLTGDHGDAEDLVQDVLARSWRRLDRGGVENADAYLNRALVNAAVSRWRHRARVRATVTAPEQTASPDRTDEVAERDRMWRALQSAPPRQRAVLVLRYYEDLPEADVAALLGISVGTVRSQNAKGLARLRSAMDAQEQGSEKVGDRP